MSSIVGIVENGDGRPIAVIGTDSVFTSKVEIDVPREADGGYDWTIADDGGDEEDDDESRYGFSSGTDKFEAVMLRFSSMSNHAGGTRVTDHENPHTANTKQ